MKKIISAMVLFVSMTLCAQVPQENDPKAKTILDELSKLTKSYKTMTAEYSFLAMSKDKKQLDKQTGKIQVKGAKFRLEIPGNIIVCDGKKVFNHNKDQKEVSIKCYEPSDDDMLDPTRIFTVYEKGFKCSFEKEEKTATGTTQIINLYPTVKPEKKKFHTAKLYVDKSKKQITSLKLLMKDGGTQTFEIKKFASNSELAEALFAMDLSKFKPEEIVNECE
jgi:outer membrane lipoprotein carrier protein